MNPNSLQKKERTQTEPQKELENVAEGPALISAPAHILF